MNTPETPSILRLVHAGWELALAPATGGRIFALRATVGGALRDVLVPVHTPHAPGSAGCYPLVPFSNRIENARFDAAGHPIALFAHPLGRPHAIHGFGWIAGWTVADQTPASATLVYTHAADAWPWPFEARQHFTLDANGFTVAMSLQNLGDTPMPAGLGFHPFFPRPDGTRLTTCTRTHWLSRPDRIPVGEEASAGPLDFSAGPILPTGLDDGFSGWNGEATLHYGNWGLRIEGRDGLDHLVIYAPDGYDFCCIEPVSHVTNAANLPPTEHAHAGWRLLAPQARWEVSMHLSVQPE